MAGRRRIARDEASEERQTRSLRASKFSVNRAEFSNGMEIADARLPRGRRQC